MDRRTRAQQRAEEIDISPTKLLADIERLTAERDAAGREKDEFLAALQRERAEFVNFRRRTAEERQAMLGLAAEGLISKVLALADDFDRAIEARPADDRRRPVGRGHRRDRPQAPPAPRERGRVARSRRSPARRSIRASTRPWPASPARTTRTARSSGELRRGYRLRDRVLRPALVAVAAGDGTAPTPRPTTPATNRPPIH